MAIKTLGPMQRGNADSLEFGFYNFRGGLNVKAAPQLVGDEDLTKAVDGYLRPDGAFQMRNGMNIISGSLGAYPLYLGRYYQTVQNGASVAEVKKLLGVMNGTLYSLALPTSTTIGSVGGSSPNPISWARFQDPDDPNYASGLTDVIIICTGVAGNGPYVYDGTNIYTPAGWADAAGAAYVAIVNGIAWFGGIPDFPNQIFGTGDGIIASFETLPAYRNFVLSSLVTGVCAQGTGATATLVVGRLTGVSVLYGTGPSTFFLQDIPFQDGIASGYSMTAAGGIVYMLGHMAYYSFDGQTIPKQISQKVEPWILNDPFTPGYPMTQNWNLTWSAFYNNRIHVGYCSNSTTPNTILCYDLNLGGWTVLTPYNGIASMILLDAPGDPNPYECVVGSSVLGQAYQWDYVSSATAAAYDFATTHPVLAQVQSKYFKIGVPGTNKALQRFYPEFQVAGVFSTNFTVSTDYGISTTQVETTNPTPVGNVLVWDVGHWDDAVWGGPMAMQSFGPPLSRLDFAGVQGESFAFGVSMTTALAPWIFSGGSGIFNQRGRT